MRVRPRPAHRAVGARCASPTSRPAREAVRALVAVGPAPGELPPDRRARGGADRAPATAAPRCSCSASSRPTTSVEPWMRARARAAAREHGGAWERAGAARSARRRGRAAGARRSCARPTCATRSSPMGVLSETFETAITWERFAAFHAAVLARRAAAVREVVRRRARSPAASRTSIPDGAGAVLHGAGAGAARRRARAVGRDQARRLATRSIAGGGTITHHHAVGRDHRPWYDRQRPEPFAAALRGGQGGGRPARAC